MKPALLTKEQALEICSKFENAKVCKTTIEGGKAYYRCGTLKCRKGIKWAGEKALNGYDRSKEAYFYFQVLGGSDHAGLWNIGITNHLDQRIKQHKTTAKKHGIKIHSIFYKRGNGQDILQFELDIKRMFPNVEMNAIGFKTETFEARDVYRFLGSLAEFTKYEYKTN